jgi:RNA polymerase sigma factor (sigma-70 family)
MHSSLHLEQNTLHSLSVESFYSRYYSELHNYCSRRLSSDDAEEIMQDLYLKLLDLPLYEIRQPRSYLYSLLNNMLIDLNRKNNVRSKAFSIEPLVLDEIVSNHPSPEVELINKQQVNALSCAINELPAEQQDLLILSRLQGLSIKEIAQKKKRSLSWVEKSMAHALLYCKRKTLRHEHD